ncbi:hypothetical protein AsAng_0064660 (plasmid) [Aureispira anguillae]|uniref:Uncharacterized protein n=1 Tax=Aureispira anguillae TaxID=2864201 RepID=A0A915YMI3_9BACT|nr:hypothetical protein AsAng_0064660 [Aureispira anguillae]
MPFFEKVTFFLYFFPKSIYLFFSMSSGIKNERFYPFAFCISIPDGIILNAILHTQKQDNNSCDTPLCA